MPSINGTPSVSDVMSIPTKFGGLANMTSGIAQYVANQYQQIQGLQLQQAQDLSKFKTLDQVYYGGQHGPQIDQILSQNPYGRALVSRGTPQGMGQVFHGQGSPMGTPGMGMNMLGMAGATPTGGSMLPSSSSPSDSSSPSTGATPPMSMASGPVVTGGTQTAFQPPTFSFANPTGEAAVSQAKAIGEGSVSPLTSYSTKMADTQALAQENLVRDNTQMTSVFRTLQNQMQLHDQLSKSNLSGTDLGELALKNLGHVGTIAALTGNNPSDIQNALVKPDDQVALGQFVAGRNEGITRAIQPLQNQVDKVGSSRISESLMDLTEGEYGKLDDTSPEFEGKTLGTAKTLYRITLASQQYADQLAAKGIVMNSSDKNFNPDKIAQTIYDNANAITLTPAQNKQFNTYWQQIKGGTQQGFTPKTFGQTLPQNQTQQGNTQSQKTTQYSPQVISKYNQLRASGVSMQDAKKQLGL